MTNTSVRLDDYRLNLLRNGYIGIWCYTCKTNRLHKPIKVNKGRYGLHKKTRYKCNICGAMRDWRNTVQQRHKIE